MTLGLLAIMLDEATYVDRWAAALKRAPAGLFDAVVVVDGGSTDGTADRLREMGLRVIDRPGNGPPTRDFADQRNFGCVELGTDWVFELDADEIPSYPLFAGLRDIMRDADAAKMDCVGIARLNFVDGILVASPGYQGLDYQYRLHNRNCHWRGAVHEEITGYRARYELEITNGHFIIHSKENGRHVVRNEYYRTLTDVMAT